MKLLLKLAWRNLWRNKRRTGITLASVFFAVILATFMMSLKEGVYKNMTEAMVASYTGFIQVHANGYWASKSIDDAFIYSDSLAEVVENHPDVNGVVQRIENFALSATDSTSKGAMVVGTDPIGEMMMTHLNERIVDGEYFLPGDKAVLIGSGLAEFHHVGVGDTMVLLGQGYHGTNAAGKYPIKGIIKFGSPELSKQLVMLPIEEAKILYGMEGNITNLVVLLDDAESAVDVAADLRFALGDGYESLAWPELVPDLVSMIEADKVEGYIFMFILYMVISFGIFGTVLMMLAERKHEFGVLVAIGMKRAKLGWVVFFETVVISVLGALIGILGALPICTAIYLNPIRFGGDQASMMEDYGMEPIIQTSIEPGIFLQQASVVALVACVIAIYPLVTLLNLNANKAMRS
ncbi:MAG: FtsX-like permease family protein [Cryomorphaceae bacterium]